MPMCRQRRSSFLPRLTSAEGTLSFSLSLSLVMATARGHSREIELAQPLSRDWLAARHASSTPTNAAESARGVRARSDGQSGGGEQGRRLGWAGSERGEGGAGIGVARERGQRGRPQTHNATKRHGRNGTVQFQARRASLAPASHHRLDMPLPKDLPSWAARGNSAALGARWVGHQAAKGARASGQW